MSNEDSMRRSCGHTAGNCPEHCGEPEGDFWHAALAYAKARTLKPRTASDRAVIDATAAAFDRAFTYIDDAALDGKAGG